MTTDKLIEIYGDFHNVDNICAMSVIAWEKERCEQLMGQVQDEDLKGELDFRVECLGENAASIQSDIQNGFLTIQGYFEKIKEYAQFESKNLKRAQKEGLDAENTNIIKQRFAKCMDEIEDFKKNIAAQEKQAEEEAARKRAEEEAKKAPVFDMEKYKRINDIKCMYFDACNYMLKVTKNRDKGK